MSARALSLLKRFGLTPSTANKAALRKAYFEQAKKLHPDVAGEAGEAQFKGLQEAYNEALKYCAQAEMRQKYGQDPSSGSSGPQGGYGWQAHDQASAEWKAYQEASKGAQYHSNFGTSSQQRRRYEAPTVVPLTPAQRIRNVIAGVLGVLGVWALGDFFFRQRHNEIPSGHRQPKPTPDEVKRKIAEQKALEFPVVEGEDGELPVIDIRRTGSGLVEQNQVSPYYKKVHQKMVIRSPRSDSEKLYKPQDDGSNEEGLGATGRSLLAFAGGASPAEGRAPPAPVAEPASASGSAEGRSPPSPTAEPFKASAEASAGFWAEGTHATAKWTPAEAPPESSEPSEPVRVFGPKAPPSVARVG